MGFYNWTHRRHLPRLRQLLLGVIQLILVIFSRDFDLALANEFDSEVIFKTRPPIE